jgi:2-amino-4-hydroxy-6-hydroxymethyldihydropteridine diphosphokinase
MNLIYLSLGSNLGYREQNIETAIQFIRAHSIGTDRISRYYESEPWGYTSRNLFCNCCLSAHTSLEPLPLMDQLLEIENEMGRRRGSTGYMDRIIDIDLLLYDNIRMDHPRLTLPHPGMANRRFVLLPLAEIAPDLIHPVRGISVSKMLALCPDHSEVRPV